MSFRRWFDEGEQILKDQIANRPRWETIKARKKAKYERNRELTSQAASSSVDSTREKAHAHFPPARDFLSAKKLFSNYFF